MTFKNVYNQDCLQKFEIIASLNLFIAEKLFLLLLQLFMFMLLSKDFLVF